jgi:hypothetical protein
VESAPRRGQGESTGGAEGNEGVWLSGSFRSAAVGTNLKETGAQIHR